MSFNFATVIQSDNPLTQNLYTEEFANVVKTPKNNFREAVDMEKYHTEMYNLQLEESKKKRLAVEQDATKRVADYNKMTKKLKDRYNKFLEKHKNDGWEGLENHWYWKHYFSNINKAGYTNLDNQLDNMKEDRFHPIELSEDGYYKVGEFEETANISTNFVENPAIYKSPYGEYMYDHDDDLLYPPQKKDEEQDEEQEKAQAKDNLAGGGSIYEDKSLIDDAFKLKQKELIREAQKDKDKTLGGFSENNAIFGGSGDTPGIYDQKAFNENKGYYQTSYNEYQKSKIKPFNKIRNDESKAQNDVKSEQQQQKQTYNKSSNFGEFEENNAIFGGSGDTPGIYNQKEFNKSPAFYNSSFNEYPKSKVKSANSEEFTSVDPKLAEIYQKTLLAPTPAPTQPPKRNLLFNYIYCLIFILFLFLVFKST